MPKRTIIFGNAFQYEPSSGHLSTTEEFGNVLVGNIGEYLPQSEVQEAIRQLGEFLEEQQI